MTHSNTEHFNGKGELHQSGQYICGVTYSLKKQKDPASGQIEISGIITVNERERVSVLNTMESGVVFTLRRADNHSLPISVLGKIVTDPFDGRYRVKAAPPGSE